MRLIELVFLILAAFGVWRVGAFAAKTSHERRLARREDEKLRALRDLITLAELDDPELAKQLQRRLAERLLPATKETP